MPLDFDETPRKTESATVKRSQFLPQVQQRQGMLGLSGRKSGHMPATKFHPSEGGARVHFKMLRHIVALKRSRGMRLGRRHMNTSYLVGRLAAGNFGLDKHEGD